mgnify:CR=1 FL=1
MLPESAKKLKYQPQNGALPKVSKCAHTYCF